MTQMRTALLADHLGTLHPHTEVIVQFNVLQIHRIGEARPSRARIELGIGGEQLGSANGATVYAILVTVPISSRERCLGTLLTFDVIQLGRKFLVLLHLRFIGGHTLVCDLSNAANCFCNFSSLGSMIAWQYGVSLCFS